MSLTAGAVSLVSVASTTADVLSGPATGGTSPYTYQWYKSVVTGFTPGVGSLIPGATALALHDTGLIPGTQYFYKMRSTDVGHSNDIIDSAQLSVPTGQPDLSPNQFAQVSILGMIDLRFDYDTVAVEISPSEAGILYAGSAVKVEDSAGGVPKVLKCAANSDEVFGFINYDVKSKSFVAGDQAEISQAGNVMYLYSTGAISRGVKVALDLTTNGGVSAANVSGGENIVGWAYDKATAAGQLIRVKLLCPSFQFDS